MGSAPAYVENNKRALACAREMHSTGTSPPGRRGEKARAALREARLKAASGWCSFIAGNVFDRGARREDEDERRGRLRVLVTVGEVEGRRLDELLPYLASAGAPASSKVGQRWCRDRCRYRSPHRSLSPERVAIRRARIVHAYVIGGPQSPRPAVGCRIPPVAGPSSLKTRLPHPLGHPRADGGHALVGAHAAQQQKLLEGGELLVPLARARALVWLGRVVPRAPLAPFVVVGADGLGERGEGGKLGEDAPGGSRHTGEWAAVLRRGRGVLGRPEGVLGRTGQGVPGRRPQRAMAVASAPSGPYGGSAPGSGSKLGSASGKRKAVTIV